MSRARRMPTLREETRWVTEIACSRARLRARSARTCSHQAQSADVGVLDVHRREQDRAATRHHAETHVADQQVEARDEAIRARRGIELAQRGVADAEFGEVPDAAVDDAPAAAEVGLSEESARTYSKRIYQKTGVARQSELVRAVLMSLLVVS